MSLSIHSTFFLAFLQTTPKTRHMRSATKKFQRSKIGGNFPSSKIATWGGASCHHMPLMFVFCFVCVVGFAKKRNRMTNKFCWWDFCVFFRHSCPHASVTWSNVRVQLCSADGRADKRPDKHSIDVPIECAITCAVTCADDKYDAFDVWSFLVSVLPETHLKQSIFLIWRWGKGKCNKNAKGESTWSANWILVPCFF